MPNRSAGRVTLWLLDLLFLLSLVGVPAVWLLDPLRLHAGPLSLAIHWRKALVLIPPALLLLRWTVRALALQRSEDVAGPLESAAVRKPVLALVAIIATLMGIEQVLQLADFEAAVAPMVVRGGHDEVHGQYGMVWDKELMWKFSPGGEFKGWKINSLGFREREISAAKAPGAARVICMGDSCSADGGPPYAGCLHALLTNAPPTPQSWEAFNMAVYGYSSLQGLRVFELKGRQLGPDIVTVYFGWNDHWLCGEGYAPDSHGLALEMSPAAARVYDVLSRKRFGQLLIRFATPGRYIAIVKKKGKLPAEIEASYRVPPDEYRRTLRRFVAEIREAGAIPLLITAPSGPRLTLVLVHTGQGKSLDQIRAAHADYVQIVRDVARETGAELLDLAAMFSGEEYAPFFSDGIHFTQDGLWRVGGALYDKIKAITAGPSWQKRRGTSG